MTKFIYGPILLAIAAFTLASCGHTDAERTLANGQTRPSPLIQAADGTLYHVACLQKQGFALKSNCKYQPKEEATALTGLTRALYSYSNYYDPYSYWNDAATFGYLYYYNPSYYSTDCFVNQYSWPYTWKSDLGYSTISLNVSTNYTYNYCDTCLANPYSTQCWSYCYGINYTPSSPPSTPTPTPVPPSPAPTPNNEILSVSISNAKMDGDMKICLDYRTGVVNITQLGSWAGFAKATFSVLTASGNQQVQVNAPQGGSAVQQLPGNWSKVTGAYAVVTDFTRVQSGNPPAISYPTTSTQACIKVVDGCCGRPNGIVLQALYQIFR